MIRVPIRGGGDTCFKAEESSFGIVRERSAGHFRRTDWRVCDNEAYARIYTYKYT